MTSSPSSAVSRHSSGTLTTVGGRVSAVDWEEAGAAQWEVTLRCPNCEWIATDVFEQDLVDQFDALRLHLEPRQAPKRMQHNFVDFDSFKPRHQRVREFMPED